MRDVPDGMDGVWDESLAVTGGDFDLVEGSRLIAARQKVRRGAPVNGGRRAVGFNRAQHGVVGLSRVTRDLFRGGEVQPRQGIMWIESEGPAKALGGGGAFARAEQLASTDPRPDL